MPLSEATKSSPPLSPRSAEEIRTWIVREVAQTLHCDPSEVDVAPPLDSHGVDSPGAIHITVKLSTWLNRNLSATLLWDHPTIHSIAEHLADTNLPGASHTASRCHRDAEHGQGDANLFLPRRGRASGASFTALAAELGRCLGHAIGLTVPGTG